MVTQIVSTHPECSKGDNTLEGSFQSTCIMHQSEAELTAQLIMRRRKLEILTGAYHLKVLKRIW